MKIKKSKDIIYKDPLPIIEGWSLIITSAKNKKIKAVVRNVKCDPNGEWQMDIHREKDDMFIMTMRWEDI